MNLKIVVSNLIFINAVIFFDPQQTLWQLTTVYGPTVASQKAQFWDSLMAIEKAWNGPWCILGDFNSILDQKDKCGGRLVAQSSSTSFRGFVQDSGLIDIDFSSNQYTWNNKRCGLSNIQERLDRGFMNDASQLLFPHAHILHLSALNSDHKPILLSTKQKLSTLKSLLDSSPCGLMILQQVKSLLRPGVWKLKVLLSSV